MPRAVSMIARQRVAPRGRRRDGSRIGGLLVANPHGPVHEVVARHGTLLVGGRYAASSASASRIGTSTPSGKRAARTSSPFMASMNFFSVPM